MFYGLYSSWLLYYWKGIILAYSDTNSCCDFCLALLEISSKVSVCSLQSRILQGLSNNYIPLNYAIDVWNTCTSLSYKTIYRIHFREKKNLYHHKFVCFSSHLKFFTSFQRRRTAESKTTVIPSVFMFQGTNVAWVLPQHFQKKHLSTSLSKFNVDLIMVMSIFRKKKKKSETKFWGGQCPSFTLPHF